MGQGEVVEFSHGTRLQALNPLLLRDGVIRQPSLLYQLPISYIGQCSRLCLRIHLLNFTALFLDVVCVSVLELCHIFEDLDESLFDPLCFLSGTLLQKAQNILRDLRRQQILPRYLVNFHIGHRYNRIR